MRRPRHAMGGAGLGLGCLAALCAAAPAFAAPDISGLWVLAHESPTSIPARRRIPQTLEGSPPPLQPSAAKLYEQRLSDSDRGRPFAALSNHCITGGMPNVMTDAFLPFQLIQSPGQVTFLFEVFHVFRIVRMGGRHPRDFDPNFFGDSVGHWEGDTLVIDTIGISDKTTLDVAGMPHSSGLHLVERLRRTGPKTLEDLVTVDDPETFTRPWTTRVSYKQSEYPLQEYICENNRNTPTADGHSSFQAR